jgi:zinc transporter
MSLRQERGCPQAVRLDGSGGARRLDAEALERWRPTSGLLWVELDEASERDRAWLAGASGLPEDHVAQFLRTDTWSRVRVAGADQPLVVIRVPDLRPQASAGASELMRFWIEPRRVITMTSATAPYLRGVKETLEAGRGPTSPGGLLLAVTESMASQLADQILRLFRPAVADLEISLEEAGVRCR